MSIIQANNISHSHYELRGQLNVIADQMAQRHIDIFKLNLGSPGLFGLQAATPLVNTVAQKLASSEAYCNSLGLFSAREAILNHWQLQQLPNTSVDQIFMGNGVSELIMIVLQALLNPGDEVLLPRPVYPLWSAATYACGGCVRFYDCLEENNWLPDSEQIAALINARTKAIVVINPNNPTGAVYPPSVLQAIGDLANKHQLVVFADEIYSTIVYEQQPFHHLAPYCQDTLTISFDGLSKNYLLAGYRCAWMICSGNVAMATDYIAGIKKLMGMRLCANVPAQHAVAPALAHPDYTFLARYPEFESKRNTVVNALNNIPGLSCDKPGGAFYLYPSWDESYCHWERDEDWLLAFLERYHILFAAGSSFWQDDQRHFRIVLLPELPILQEVVAKLAEFQSDASH